MGKSVFTKDLFDAICERIACGESLVTILSDGDMPSYSTFMRWLEADEGDLRDKYARAREAQGDYSFDQVGHIAKQVLSGELDPQAARVAADMIKWRAGKLRANKYGDKTIVSNDPENPMPSNDAGGAVVSLLIKRLDDIAERCGTPSEPSA